MSHESKVAPLDPFQNRVRTADMTASKKPLVFPLLSLDNTAYAVLKNIIRASIHNHYPNATIGFGVDRHDGRTYGTDYELGPPILRVCKRLRTIGVRIMLQVSVNILAS